MGKEPHLRGKEPLALVVDEVVHPDVVFGDVLIRHGARLCDGLVDLGGDALGEALGEPDLGPLPPRPLVALVEPLIERREREVEQHDEGELVLEEVVEHVRRRILPGEDLVERHDRPEIEVRLAPARERDLEHVTVELLEEILEPLEHLVERRLVPGEAARGRTTRTRPRHRRPRARTRPPGGVRAGRVRAGPRRTSPRARSRAWRADAFIHDGVIDFLFCVHGSHPSRRDKDKKRRTARERTRDRSFPSAPPLTVQAIHSDNERTRHAHDAHRAPPGGFPPRHRLGRLIIARFERDVHHGSDDAAGAG